MKDAKRSSNPKDSPNLLREGNSKADIDIRAELGHKLREILISKRLTQRDLATLLAIQQPEVSHLLNGHFGRFSIGKLIQFYYRLGWMVKFQIYPLDTDQ